MTQTGWLIRDGVSLAIHGGGDHGLPLVFQHGLCGDARQVAEAMAGLDGQRWQCLECRGHGASAMGDVSIAAFADDLAAMIEAMPGPVILGGISMGAAIGTRLAVIRPDLVRALVLVRPAWGVGDAPENLAPNAEVGALLTRLPAAQARAAFASGATAGQLAHDAPDNLASLLGFFDRAPQAATARLLTTISADGPGVTAADLAALAVPTLICATPEDAIHPVGMARVIAAMIPSAHLVMLPAKGRDKTAHLAALAAAMTDFLRKVSDAPTRRWLDCPTT